MRKIGIALAVSTMWLLTPAASASSVPGAPNCPMFPADNIWHANVSQLPVHPMSNTYINSIGSGAAAKADFGSGLWDGGPIGIPYDVVGAGQQTSTVTFDFDEDSDHVAYPIPANPSIEGGTNSTGDRHVLIVDNATCKLYELYDAHPTGNNTWHAGSGAVWSLNSNALRTDTFTSGDAAGLPILPGLVRYDEVASGRIDHAIRVTVPSSNSAHLWPARHDAGSTNANLPPMGLRLRLKAGFNISSYPHDDQVILQAMKTYGLIVADNGSPWYMTGVPDSRWDNDVLQMLRNVHGSDFEAVDESGLMISSASGQARPTAAPATKTWFLRDSNTSGVANRTINFGAPGDAVMVCDWNGDGTATPGTYRNGVVSYTDSTSGGASQHTLTFGMAGDVPTCGDWNGDGTDTIGVHRGGTFYLRNTNTSGVADITISYGNPGDVGITGDWNGDGTDTFGVHRGGTFFLRNTNTSGVADITIGYGDPGDVAIAGDWNGDGTDTFGVHRGGTFYLRNTNTSGVADITIGYGDPGDTAVAGDWNGDGTDTFGVVR